MTFDVYARTEFHFWRNWSRRICLAYAYSQSVLRYCWSEYI